MKVRFLAIKDRIVTTYFSVGLSFYSTKRSYYIGSRNQGKSEHYIVKKEKVNTRDQEHKGKKREREIVLSMEGHMYTYTRNKGKESICTFDPCQDTEGEKGKEDETKKRRRSDEMITPKVKIITQAATTGFDLA